MNLKTNKKGFNIGDLLPIGMTLVVLTIGLAVGLQINGDIQNDMGESACGAYWNEATGVCQVSAVNTSVYSANPVEYTATGEGIAALAQIPPKLGIIVTVIVAAVIIGILIRYLMMRNA